MPNVFAFGLMVFLLSCVSPAWGQTGSELKYKCAQLRHGFGYIDHRGKFVISPRFDWCDPFHEGLARALRFDTVEDIKSKEAFSEGRGGFINKSGAYAIQQLQL